MGASLYVLEHILGLLDCDRFTDDRVNLMLIRELRQFLEPAIDELL